MIPTDLLDQLREKDPGLWDKLQEQFEKLKAYQEDRVYEVDVIATFECLPQMSGWILQGLLQEAIRARGLGYRMRCLDWADATIFDDLEDRGQGEGDTEAEALLIAYLAAI